MSGIRMLEVMFAMLLFSTILITVYNGLALRNEMVYRVMVQQQGHKLADRYVQKVQADLLGKIMTFDEVHDFYNPSRLDSLTLYHEKYMLNIVSNYCSSSGNLTAPDSGFQRIDIRVNVVSKLASDTLRIGTRSNPVSRVFADMY